MSLSVDQKAIRIVSLALVSRLMEMKIQITSRSGGSQEPDSDLRQFLEGIQQHENTYLDWGTVKEGLLSQGFLGLLAVRRTRNLLNGQLQLAINGYQRAEVYKNSCFDEAAIRRVPVDMNVAGEWLEEMDKHEREMILIRKQLDLLQELE